MRVERVLHSVSGVVLLACGVLNSITVLLFWRDTANTAPRPILPCLRSLVMWSMPLLALGVVYLRPSRIGRWIALALLAGLAIQSGYEATGSAIDAADYRAIARAGVSATSPVAGRSGDSASWARMVQAETTRMTVIYTCLALWAAIQLIEVSRSRRYWEGMPDEPRPSAQTRSLPPPSS